MTDEEIEAMARRAETINADPGRHSWGEQYGRDVPLLLAELKRLNEDNAYLRTILGFAS